MCSSDLGDVYNLPTDADIMVSKDQFVDKNDVLATTAITSDYGGTVRLSNSLDEIHIITASTSLDTASIIGNKDSLTNDSPYILKLEDGSQFLMHCSPGNKLSNSQIIAELIDNSYNTTTGGFLKYSNIDKCKLTKNKKSYEVIDDLLLYWIPEETHEINKDMSLLMAYNGEIIDVNQELLKDLYSKTSGILFVTESNGVVQELTIKPGYLHKLSNNHTVDKNFESRICEPNEDIVKDLTLNETSFIELVKFENKIGRAHV